MALYQNAKTQKLPGSEIEVVAEIPAEEVAAARPRVVKKLVAKVKLPGFREGHVPEKLALERVGEMAILEEIAEELLPGAYAAIVTEKKLDVVGRPRVSITKLAPGNPIAFTARSAIMPEVVLPNVKGVARDVLKKLSKEPDPVSEEDIDKVIDTIKKNKHARATEQNDQEKGAESGAPLPELTPEDLQEIGNFKNLEELRGRIKENMSREREQAFKEDRRIKIADALIEKTAIDLPAIFVEAELDKIVHELKGRMESLGLAWSDYLSRVSKTEDAVRLEARGEAEKRAKLQLILAKIAEDEKIEPDQEASEREAKHILEHYKDADPERVKTYVETLFRNEKVYQLLEGSEKD